MAFDYNSAVSYEEGLAALNSGDFQTAAPLLAEAAREAGYTSFLLNNAFTLALHHIGDKSRLADVAFSIGNSLVEQDPAAAMDFFQRAISADLDAGRVRSIGRIFERWAADVPERSRPSEPHKHVAHVVGRLSAGDSRTQYLRLLVSSLHKQGIESTVFTTESAASWFFNSARGPQSQAIQIEADVNTASVEGDFDERATRIANAISSSGVSAAFFHSSLAEQITARVASLRPAPVQVNVNHGTEMEADLFDGRIHLPVKASRRTQFKEPAVWIPPSFDIESRLRASATVSRQAMGLESARTVSATIGNLSDAGGSGYLHALAEILSRFPEHFHLFAGAGNVKAIRSYLHSEGVLPRVRFFGQMDDVAGLLPIIDIYLASFPQSDSQPIVEAMAAGKPALALRLPEDFPKSCGSEIVGIPELTAPGEGDYIQKADRLLRDSGFRAAQGKLVLDRFRAEFHPDRLGERYKAFLTVL